MLSHKEGSYGKRLAIVFLHGSYDNQEWMRLVPEAYASWANIYLVIEALYYVERAENSNSYEYFVVYKMGARKFVVFGAPPAGCPPNLYCIGDTKTPVKIYNAKLQVKLEELSSILLDSTIVVANLTKLGQMVLKNPLHYGFKDTTHTCARNNIPCANRSEFMLWDDAHPA